MEKCARCDSSMQFIMGMWVHVSPQKSDDPEWHEATPVPTPVSKD